MPSEYIPVVGEEALPGFVERNLACLDARVRSASESNDVANVAVLAYGFLKITYTIVNAGILS